MGVQALHALPGSTPPCRWTWPNVAFWNLGITFGRVPVMGISQFNRITGCLSITHSTRGLQGPYTRTQLTTHQPVEGRHRPPAVKKGVVADDNRLTGIVTYDNLESPTRCPSQEFGDEFLVGLGRSGDMHGIRIRWCSGHALNDEQDHDHDDYCSHYQWEQALDHGRSSGIKEVQHLGLGGVYDTYPLNLVRSLDDVLGTSVMVSRSSPAINSLRLSANWLINF